MKKLFAMLCGLLMPLSLTACKSEQLSLAQQLKEKDNWKIYKTTENWNYQMIGPNGEIHFERITNSDINHIQEEARIQTFLTDLTDASAIPNEIDLYVKNHRPYFNKNYLLNLYTLFDIEVPRRVETSNLQYIALEKDPTVDFSTLIGHTSTTQDSLAVYAELLKNLNLDIPIIKQDNHYTIKLDNETIIKILSSLIPDESTESESNPSVDNLLIPDLSQANLTAQLDYMFDENSHQYILKIIGTLEDIQINIQITSATEKLDDLTITLPSTITEFSASEYDDLFLLKGLSIDLETGDSFDLEDDYVDTLKPLFKEDKLYLPLRKLMMHLGYDVYFDATSKQTNYGTLNHIQPISSFIHQEIAYVGIDELFAHGFNLFEDGDYIIIAD